MLLVKLIKNLIVSLFLAFLIIITTFLYLIKKNYSADILKYNIINTIYQKYGIILNFKKIEYSKPDKFIIRGLNIVNADIKLKSESLKININVFHTIISKGSQIILQNLDISDMRLDIVSTNKEKNIIKQIEELFSMLYDLNLITIRNSDIKIPTNSLNIKVNEFKSSRALISDSLNIEFNGAIKLRNKEYNLEALFDLSKEHIIINKLTTNISSKTFELFGKIYLTQNLKSELQLKVNSSIDIKDFTEIPKPIIIEPTKLDLTVEINNKSIIKVDSKIPSLNAKVKLKYNIEKNKIEELAIDTKKVNSQKLNNYLQDYLKNHNGEIDLKITYNDKDTLKIEAETKNFSFTDKMEIFNFKNTDAKLILTKNQYDLNIIKTKTSTPQWNINGGIHILGNQEYETINANLNLNGKKLISKIKIKDIHNKNKRTYEIDIKTENFSFKEAVLLDEYIKGKISKIPKKENDDSIYNFVDKKLNLKLISNGYLDDPYISAKKIIINANYNKTNEILQCDGEFRVKIIDGQIKNIQQNIKENKTYELMLLPLTQLHRLNRIGALKINYELKTINFYDIGSHFKANNGKIIVDKFYLNSVEFLIYSRGEVDFKLRTINMEVYVINRKNYTQGTLPETLTDAKGRPSLAFRVIGKFEKNDIKLIEATNITNLVETEVKKSIEIEE